MSDSGTSPFIYKKLTCPACTEDHEHPHFRLRMYLEGERESDGHVLEYKWIAEKATPVHPPYYYLFFCPRCYYADLTNDFSRPGDNEHTPLVLRAYKRALDREKEVIEFLGDHIRYDNITFETALLIHFLGAFIQLLTPQSEQDNLKLARLFLRIAWLYREQAPQQEDGGLNRADKSSLEALADFENALHTAREHWVRTSVVLGRQIDEVDYKGNVSEQSAQIRQHRSNVEKLLEAEFAEVFRLKRLLKEGSAASGDDAAGKTGGDSEFYKLMVSLKSMWPMAPSDENEAMRLSLQYLQQAISTDPAFDNSQTYLNGISLVVDLLIRCNDLNAAFDTVRGIYRGAAEARSRLMDELKPKDLDENTKQRLLGRIRKLSRSVEHAGELRTKLIGLLVERDRELIHKILRDNAGISESKVMAALEENGIVPGVVAYLQEKGELTPAKTKALRDAQG
ncbi:MAG: DUF2225 domain-containing protein [Candidatus Hydrogenedentes bacterium]|nr:DUF2225 domain-containing protein [Candidatus Hydrogenedentota bacterium]